MPPAPLDQDAVIIGGGFYGAVIAAYLAKERGVKRVLLVEREPELLSRASYHNQARVHNGYHYPRSFTTAYRSRINLPRFVADWSSAVKKDFTKLYAIARRNSKVTAKQFERFCLSIGAKLQLADKALFALFTPRLIEAVFLVEEYAFDASMLKGIVRKELAASGVTVMCKTQAMAITKTAEQTLKITLRRENGTEEQVSCRYVFNCTYSGLNQLHGDFPGTQMGLKHEITEMALVDVPPALRDIAVTVMDGPFFSMMPFPAKGLHTLSHVRYTPHLSWNDACGSDPYQKLQHYDRHSRIDRMLRDVSRYMPSMETARYVESLFEVKTVLLKNEVDDGRPILCEKHEALPGCYSILGGKIDNIYDVLEKLNAESFA